MPDNNDDLKNRLIALEQRLSQVQTINKLFLGGYNHTANLLQPQPR